MIRKGTQVNIRTVNGGRFQALVLVEEYRPTYPLTICTQYGGYVTILADRIESVTPVDDPALKMFNVTVRFPASTGMRGRTIPVQAATAHKARTLAKQITPGSIGASIASVEA